MQTTKDITTTQTSLGQRIHTLREQEGLSQHKFAAMIGMSRTYLVDVEKDRRNITLKTIRRIARGLDVSMAELFTGVDVEYQSHN